jgi:hypothetical protein
MTISGASSLHPKIPFPATVLSAKSERGCTHALRSRNALVAHPSLPVFPNWRTFSGSFGMFQRCHFRTHGRPPSNVLPLTSQNPLDEEFAGRLIDGERRRPYSGSTLK